MELSVIVMRSEHFGDICSTSYFSLEHLDSVLSVAILACNLTKVTINKIKNESKNV